MASNRSILRLFAERGLPPAEVVSQVNRVLVKDFPRAKFVTMIYAIIDPARRSIVFANASHLPPLFVDSTGSRFLEIDSGLPLGIQEVSFTAYGLDMPAGSRLLLRSDGVSEAMNSSLEEYGATRIRDHLTNPSASVQSLLDDVRAFARGSSKSRASARMEKPCWTMRRGATSFADLWVHPSWKKFLREKL